MKAIVITDRETKLPIAFVEVRDYLDREEMLRMMDVNKNGLTLSLTNPSDYSIMLNYMVNAA